MQTLAANTDEGKAGERSESCDRMDIRLRTAASPYCGAGFVVERRRATGCARNIDASCSTGAARMKLRWLIGGAALSLVSGWALAQNAPESLLPPGFDEPAPAPAARPAPAPAGRPAPAARPAPTPPAAASRPVVQEVPSSAATSTAPAADVPASLDPQIAAKLPTLEELERMTPEEFEEALGLQPKFDVPPAARRATQQVGLIDVAEGGLASESLQGVNAVLLRRILQGNRGALFSRWGHIMLRRALASRLDAPSGMNGADFAAMRAALLLRMGETEVARQLVQDIDTDNYTPMLTNAAFDAYVWAGDFTGICSISIGRNSSRDDAQWNAASDICSAFRGDGRAAFSRLDRSLRGGKISRIDVLLAQRYAGAAGQTRRAVTIEWDGVDEITPWRYGLATAVGLTPPEALMKKASPRYSSAAALSPVTGLADRALAADRAGSRGVLSSKAMVDLYGQLHSNQDITGDWSERAETLRRAYVLRDPSARLSAMQSLWNSAGDPQARYSRQVLTAYAAARLPAVSSLDEQAPDLIASMLSAGLDRNALRWAEVVESGTQGWALLALASPAQSASVSASMIDTFISDDESVRQRKSAFLVAGLAGLGRIDEGTMASLSDQLELNLERKSRWSNLISLAAARDRAALVALLAGLGMQGTSWEKMPPRYLYHIVSALRRVGMEAEARMIAAEAVARA